MKKYILFIIALFSIGTYSFAQFDPIADELIPSDMEPCQLNKNTEIKDCFKTKLDSNWRDINLTTIAEDDVSKYKKKKLDDTLRLVYFLHGLGGNRGSWSAVHDAHLSDYKYFPYRLDYSEGWESGGSNQRDFQLASEVTQQDMDEGRSRFLNRLGTQGTEVGLPYVIAHSQGGLVARDLDMKYATGMYPILDSTDRRFWGMVTVGSPHAGALIAINQEAMDALGADLANKLIRPYQKSLLNDINLKIPFYSKRLNSLYNTADKLVYEVSTFLADSLLQMVTKEKRDPITRQYGPNSTYLNDTLNHSTPDIAKAAFYGIEDDPVLWRIATYMVGKDPSEYNTYQANNDGDLGQNMEDLRLKFIAEAYSTSIQIKNHNSRLAKCKWWKPWKCMGNKNLRQERDSLIVEKEAWEVASDFLGKANLSYKVIIGGVDPNKMYSVDTVGWKCTKTTVVQSHFISVPPIIETKIVTDPADCNWGVSPGQHGPLGSGHYISFSTEPIIEKILVEIPTDATVTVPSQKALPGCDIRFVKEMNEVLDHQNPSWDRVIIRSGVNHMQQRNCDQTDAMLRRIYEGYGTPSFFTLERR